MMTIGGEGNKLIADFMGLKLRKGTSWSKALGYADEFIMIKGEPKWSLSDVPYNSSWESCEEDKGYGK